MMQLHTTYRGFLMQVTKLEVYSDHRIWTLSRPTKTKPYIVREALVSGVAKNTYQVRQLQGKVLRSGTVSFPHDFKGSYHLPIANVLFSAIKLIIDYQDLQGTLLPDIAGKFPITAEGISWTL